jgi:hypothetical protein
MLLDGKLRRFVLAERERFGRRLGGLNHASRLLHSLHVTVAEYEQAVAAVVANVEEQEHVDATVESELFAEGGRLGVVVHRRVETFAALSRLLLERVGGLLAAGQVPAELEAKASALAELAGAGDLRVVSAPGARQVRTTFWEESGNAQLSVLGTDETSDDLTLRGWLQLLEDYVGGVADYLEVTSGRTGSRP